MGASVPGGFLGPCMRSSWIRSTVVILALGVCLAFLPPRLATARPPPWAIAAPAPSATPPTDAGDGRVGEMKAKDGEEEGRGESSHDDDDL